MNKTDSWKIFKIEMIGAAFISVLGSFLHFTFNLSNNFWVVGTFSAINESTWEHLKLAVIPSIIWMIASKIIFKIKNDNFLWAKTVSIYLAPLLIISGFYLYTAIIGSNFLIIDISLFIASVVIAQYVSYKIMTGPRKSKIADSVCLTLISVLLLTFFLFSFYPPKFFLFKNPL